ncbi:hypothetical protein GCM10027074_53650 [Streptomyces deserti]
MRFASCCASSAGSAQLRVALRGEMEMEIRLGQYGSRYESTLHPHRTPRNANTGPTWWRTEG